MKRRWISLALLTALFGTGMHFLYDLWPNALVGLFAPVNESVWEHLKLLYWPFLIFGGCLAKHADAPARTWSGVLLAQLVMPAALLSAYYVLRCGFLVTGLWVDVALYYLTVALGFYLCWRRSAAVCRERELGILIALNGIYAMCLILFTLATPNLPIFLTT